ncbi:MAG: adenylosuccinate synthetase [Phycisphaerales bacterium]
MAIERIVLLSGHVSAGKTTLVDLLRARFDGLECFKTRDYLRKLNPDVEASRLDMQTLGERYDIKTKGAWVSKGLWDFIADNTNVDIRIVLVDAVRIRQQISAIRKAFGSKVVHFHLNAPPEELKKRYRSRPHRGIRELLSYDEVLGNPTEQKVDDLAKIADVVIDTKRCTKQDVMVKAASCLELYGRENTRSVDILVGGQYGSEGKGNIAAYLAREYDVLVRVGGPNAGHKVYSEPEPLNFHHLPSGSVSAPESQLLIGPGATIYVPALLDEIAQFNIDLSRLKIDGKAMIISKKDRASEKDLVAGIGSTGQGVGAAQARRIRGRKPGMVTLARDIKNLHPFICDSCEFLERAFERGDKVFLEGTQGTGLSLYHGDYPYVTSRDTTVSGCLAEAGISAARVRRIVMVCRTYPIRVKNPDGGTSGPMTHPLSWAEIARRSGYKTQMLTRTERGSTTNRRRRVGEFEWTSLRKAVSLNAPTDIALTFVDYICRRNEDARRFEQLNEETIRFVEEVERVARTPVTLISTRFDYRNIIDRRTW